MARPVRNTFGAMSASLRSLGFSLTRRDTSIVFAHPNGGPIILLPAYKSGQAVRPIHRMMVNKQLMDAGLLHAGQIAIPGRSRALPRRKAPSGSGRNIEA